MKVYKVEILILNFDGLSQEEIKDEIENVNYPNDCISPKVMHIESKEIGEWDDSNLLNHRETAKAEYERLFTHD